MGWLNKVHRIGVVALAMFLKVSLLLTSVALAGQTVCDRPIRSGTLDNVIVPAGTSCTLEGSVVVEGNVEAHGAADVIIDGIIIHGNIAIEESNGTEITIRGAQVDGNVSLVKNTADVEVQVVDTAVGGNVTLVENEAVFIFVGSCGRGGNTVASNVTVKNNSGGFVVVNCSHVAGNVTVKHNSGNFNTQVNFNTVDGNVTVKHNSGRLLVICCSHNSIGNAFVGGNLTVEKNTIAEDIFVGSFLTFSDMTVAGNVKVDKNTAGEGIFVQTLTVDGNLECKENEPAPMVSGNTIAGNDNCLN